MVGSGDNVTTEHPGIPNWIDARCPLCQEELHLLVQTAEITRVVSEVTLSSMGGGEHRFSHNQRVEAKATWELPHTCKNIPKPPPLYHAASCDTTRGEECSCR